MEEFCKFLFGVMKKIKWDGEENKILNNEDCNLDINL